MKHYNIFLNKQPYMGELPECSEAAPPRHTGWTGHSPTTRGKLHFGGTKDTPLRISSNRNLRSHMERILDREGYGIDLHDLHIVTLPGPTR